MTTKENNFLENLNKFMLTENITTSKNASLWNEEIKKQFSNEKTARRKLRTIQLNLSKHLLAMQKIKNDKKLNEAKKQLADFYKNALVDKTKFSNVSKEKDTFKLLNEAYNLIKDIL